MDADRINGYINLGTDGIGALMHAYAPEAHVLGFVRMNEGMGNTGYKVTTDKGCFLLKLYSNQTFGTDTAMYRYLYGKVNVPKLCYSDFSNSLSPYAYTVTEFIDGVTLAKYLKTQKSYPAEFARESGRMCAQIHATAYPHDGVISFSDSVPVISKKLPKTREKILMLLVGKSGKHLQKETASELRAFIRENSALFDMIESESVLCHGDYGYGNIMVSGESMYCIDFEFAYAGSRYHDIGHFFRRKDDRTQALIGEEIYSAFAEGYNSVSQEKLPPEWLRLSKLCDVNAMLCLLNYDGVPAEWVTDIEADIRSAVRG